MDDSVPSRYGKTKDMTEKGDLWWILKSWVEFWQADFQDKGIHAYRRTSGSLQHRAYLDSSTSACALTGGSTWKGKGEEVLLWELNSPPWASVSSWSLNFPIWAYSEDLSKSGVTSVHCRECWGQVIRKSRPDRLQERKGLVITHMRCLHKSPHMAVDSDAEVCVGYEGHWTRRLTWLDREEEILHLFLWGRGTVMLWRLKEKGTCLCWVYVCMDFRRLW